MPELPEVQTVLDTLEGQIKDKVIDNIMVFYDSIVENKTEEFKKKLIGQHFRNFLRRGKYLLFEMDDVVLVSHLRMEGKYFLLDSSEPFSKHDHVVFCFDDGKQLRYNDVRKFGRMEIIDKQKDYSDFKNLGPEPFGKDFNLQYCLNYLKDNNKPIKQVLLDQSFVAGIGNIYADEILFAMRINPSSKAGKLDEQDIKNLIKYTRSILKKAIKAGGTTIRSYTSAYGITGRFQLSLMVHEQKICHNCKHDIVKTRVASRGTYYCPICQKIKE